jgi:L-threonylcarbamoyladenylate synthase
MTYFRDDIEKAVEALKGGGLIIYPTDTIWGIGCDATNEKAVQKIFKIKKRPSIKSMIVLLESIEKLQQYLPEVPEIAVSLIEQFDKPLTIIYPKAKNIAKSACAGDGSIAIRVVRDAYCIELCKMLNKPIVSTSANISVYDFPLIFREIDRILLDKVDYVALHSRDEIRQIKPSTIVRLKNNWEYEIMRD